MPNLPDIPGKDLIAGTSKRARAIAVGAGAGALALGGFVVKKVLSRGGDHQSPAAEPVAFPNAATSDAVPPAVPTGEGRRMATHPEAPPKPKAAPNPEAAPKPAAKPKAAPKPEAAPKPAPKPKAAPKPKPEAAPKPAPKPKAAPKPKPAPKPKAASKPKASKPKPGTEPGDQRGGKDPHHALNNPVTDPDPTADLDPFEKDADPRELPPAQDPEVGDRAKPPRRDNLDD